MKLVSYKVHNSISIGVVNESGDIVDLQGAYGLYLRQAERLDWKTLSEKLIPKDMVCFLENGEEGINAAKQAFEYINLNYREALEEGIIIPESQAVLLAPVLNPKKITLVGKNYEDHALEDGGEVPDYPDYFAAYQTAINHPDFDVVIPTVSEKVDWEAELGVVIGKTGRDISKEDALDYVAGYTIINDVSVRDYQLRSSQWIAGKSFDGHLPMGPFLITKDEIKDPQTLDITLKVNGEVMQHSNTRNMVFKIAEVISDMSKIWTLQPGDVIATGTMAGVGTSMTPPRYLKDQDVVTIEVEKVGVLRNKFVNNV